MVIHWHQVVYCTDSHSNYLGIFEGTKAPVDMPLHRRLDTWAGQLWLGHREVHGSGHLGGVHSIFGVSLEDFSICRVLSSAQIGKERETEGTPAHNGERKVVDDASG